jgi:hypothetical protein
VPTIPARLDAAKLGRPLTRAEHDELIARTMTEKQLEAAVAGRARVYGWRRYHTHRSDRSPAGFPDDALVRAGRLAFLELKTEAGKLSTEQAAWLADLELVATYAGLIADGRPLITVRVIRPRDLFDGTLDELLR